MDTDKSLIISFDLAKATVFIPSGRLMNLKKSLEWNEKISFDQKELTDAVSSIQYEKFETDNDFSQITENFVKEVLKDTGKKYNRHNEYDRLGYKIVIRPELFAEVIHDLTEGAKNDLKQLCQDTLQEDIVKSKLLKLNQLRAINAPQI